jgi:hypothetical protein
MVFQGFWCMRSIESGNCESLGTAGIPRIRPLPVSVTERMASVPWRRSQSAHEARAPDGSQGSSWPSRRAVTQSDRPPYRGRYPGLVFREMSLGAAMSCRSSMC